MDALTGYSVLIERIYLRTFFPRRGPRPTPCTLRSACGGNLALAAASVGVAETPIEHGAQSDHSFAETRDEIERIENEETDIFERGGTESAAQTGEEYRQELRRALNEGLEEEIRSLPWKAGSGFVRGQQTGHFFCAKIGDQTYLRFVPQGAEATEEVVEELGTCLRLIECDDSADRHLPDDAQTAAFGAWTLAQENIWAKWQHYTDPKNLQPKVRKLNREVDAYLAEHPPAEVGQDALDRISEVLLSPWPMREENRLREVWKEEHAAAQDKAKALFDAVEATGIEPYEVPPRFPSIDRDEVRLVCWLYIEARAPVPVRDETGLT